MHRDMAQIHSIQKVADRQILEWNVTPNQAIRIQDELRKKVKIQSLDRPIRTIGGSDISFNVGSNTAYAVFVVFDFQTMQQIDSAYFVGEMKFPYIPGLLSFREIPLLIEAWHQLKIKPDVMMIDGQGIAHPRRLGIASHFGVLMEVPTLGCAKSKLVGLYEEPANQAQAYSKLIYRSDFVGFAYRTRINVKPIFVSPGHLMDFSDALNILKSSGSGFRIPKPTRSAHIFANQIRVQFK